MDLRIKKFYGINWTLDDFVLEKEVALPSGIILPAGSRYFTWKESMILQRLGVFPEGCRLPTAREFHSLAKNVGPLTVKNRLYFNTYYGFRDFSSIVKGEGECGYYWSSSSGRKHNAVRLEVTRSRVAGVGWCVGAWVGTSYRDYGNSIRLVYDPV